MPRTKGSKDTKKRKVTPNKGMFQKGNPLAKGTKRTRTAPNTLAIVSNVKIDKALIDRYLTANSHMTVDQLIRRLNLGDVSVLEGMLIKGLLKAYRTGDPHNLNFFLDRLVGKVPTRVAHSLENELKDMDDATLVKEKEKYALALREEIKVGEKKLETKLKAFEQTEFIDDDGEIRKAIDIVNTAKKTTPDTTDKD